MALPKLASAKYSLKIPSTGQTVEYRPYLVKEEKVLMMAFESKDQSQMITALRDTIAGCTEGKVKVEELPIFDLEYIFLNLRAKSVGETSTLSVKCKECAASNRKEVNLSDVKVIGEIKKERKIELTDTVGVILRYPTVKALKNNTGLNELDSVMGLVTSAIESIYDADNVYPADLETEASLRDFVDSLTSDQFKKITSFFEDSPRLKHTLKFKCVKCSADNSIDIEGLQNFF